MIIDIIVVLIEAMFVLAFGFALCVMPIIFIVGCIRNIYRKFIGYDESCLRIENYSYVKTHRKKSHNNFSIRANNHNKMIQPRHKRKIDTSSPIKITDYSARNNPASGLPMAGRSAIDISGNTFGTRR